LRKSPPFFSSCILFFFSSTDIRAQVFRASRGTLELINQKKLEHGNTAHGIKLFAGKYTNSGLLHVDACTPQPRPPT
jgi:hypothetical protein